MKAKLLDSAHGWEADDLFLLVQYWEACEGELAKITVRYDTDGLRYSSADLVITNDDDTVLPEQLLRLRAFPSQWWKKFDLPQGEELDKALLWLVHGIAGDLLKRLAAMHERLNDKAGYVQIHGED